MTQLGESAYLSVLLALDQLEIPSLQFLPPLMNTIKAATLSLILLLASGRAAVSQTPPHWNHDPAHFTQLNHIQLRHQGYLSRGGHDSYEFRGDAGRHLTISLSSPHFDTYLELYDTNGRLIAENDDSNSTLDSQVRITLPSSGIYTVVVRSFSADGNGEYSLVVEDTSSEFSLRNQPGYLFRGELVQHTFQGTAGELVTIALDSDQFDPYLLLFDANGRVLAENDDYNGVNSMLQFRLPYSGTYSAGVRGFSPDGQGDYSLSIR